MLNSRIESAQATSASSAPMSPGYAIEELLRIFAEIHRRDQGSQAPTESRPTAWEDDEYQYIEAKVDRSRISFCDINIMEGKVFIRIVREHQAEESDEYLPRIATISLMEIPAQA